MSSQPEIPGASEYAAALARSSRFRQPDIPPARQPMSPKAQRLADELKSAFRAYNNQLARAVQTTLGPSEIGTPCDRRLAMSLLGIAPVNTGGDKWSSFVGVCIHEGLANMFRWLNEEAGNLRYSVEEKLMLPTQNVPHGTGDLLDRTLCLFADHKNMNASSRDSLKINGPSPSYRVQIHTYAYAAELKGEQVEDVAIIAWPRDASTLADLYIWMEPYDKQVAVDALDRVDQIAEDTERKPWMSFPMADDCKWCPHNGPSSCPGIRKGRGVK